MTKDKLIQKLKEKTDKIRRFGVKRIEIFSSVVRGELTKRSDIDFVVEFERGKEI